MDVGGQETTALELFPVEGDQYQLSLGMVDRQRKVWASSGFIRHKGCNESVSENRRVNG